MSRVQRGTTEVAARKKPTTRKPAVTKPAKAEAAPDEAAIEAVESQGDETVVDADDTKSVATETPDLDKDADSSVGDASDRVDVDMDNAAGDEPGTDAEPASEHTAKGPFHPPAPTPAEAPQSGGFGGLVFGGIVAALIGAFAAFLVLPQLGFGAKDQSAELATLQTRLEDQSGRIAAGTPGRGGGSGTGPVSVRKRVERR